MPESPVQVVGGQTPKVPKLGQVRVEIVSHWKWWVPAAFYLIAWAIRLGLVRDQQDSEFWDGIQPASYRAAKWLVKHGLIITSASAHVKGWM